MWRDMESLVERLDEAAGVTSAQAQLNKKRELEVVIGWLLCAPAIAIASDHALNSSRSGGEVEKRC